MAIEAADKVLSQLTQKEIQVANLIYKNGFNEKAVSEDLKISIDMVESILKSVQEKIKLPYYNESLINMVEVDNPNSTNAIEKLKEMVGIKK